MEWNPHFYPAVFGDHPTWRLPGKVLRSQNEINKKQEERGSITNVFPANRNLKRKGHETSPSSLTQARPIEIWAGWLGWEFLIFAGFCQFSQETVYRLWREWGGPAGLTVDTKHWGLILDPSSLSWNQSNQGPSLVSKLDPIKLWQKGDAQIKSKSS